MTTYTIALPIVLGYICYALSRQKKDKDANTKGTMLLLRVELIEYHDKYMERGSIPSYAYQNFCEMYECYKSLGGNGMVSKMYEEITQINLHGAAEKTNKKKTDTRRETAGE